MLKVPQSRQGLIFGLNQQVSMKTPIWYEREISSPLLPCCHPAEIAPTSYSNPESAIVSSTRSVLCFCSWISNSSHSGTLLLYYSIPASHIRTQFLFQLSAVHKSLHYAHDLSVCVQLSLFTSHHCLLCCLLPLLCCQTSSLLPFSVLADLNVYLNAYFEGSSNWKSGPE